MIAFEVLVDGKKLCTAGVPDPGSLHVGLMRTARSPGESMQIHLSVGGVGIPSKTEETQDAPAMEPRAEMLQWLSVQDLELKGALEVRVVEAEAVDEPTSRRPAQRARGACTYCGKDSEQLADRRPGEKYVFLFHARGNICGECVEGFAKEIAELRKRTT